MGCAQKELGTLQNTKVMMPVIYTENVQAAILWT
jgi:hypothetical protein